ncbi:MAG: hypothetical protein AB7O43_20785 [Hyphomicrobiaceae bacterium]
MVRVDLGSIAALPFLLAIAGCSSTPPASPFVTSAITKPGAAANVGDAAGSEGRGKRVIAGKATHVDTLMSFDKRCNPVEPQITVVKPPAKGTVSFGKGKMATVQYSASGTCIGRSLPATVVTYTSNAGATGNDSFSISARSAAGDIGSKSFNVTIME